VINGRWGQVAEDLLADQNFVFFNRAFGLDPNESKKRRVNSNMRVLSAELCASYCLFRGLLSVYFLL
jgi:hypothetical protein